MGDRVRITDVAPRDGLQNESGIVPTTEKARLVNAIARSGVDEVEVTSFVSPTWIPQLADAAKLCAMIAETKPEGVEYSALVPNERGMERLLAVNEAAVDACSRRVIDRAGFFIAASESFSRKNTNASIAETIERFGPIARMSKEAGLGVRAYVSCVIACPFEGPIEPASVARVAGMLGAFEPDEIDLGDTIGAGGHDSISQLLEALDRARSAGLFSSHLALHLHDTHGRAGECVRSGLEAGIRRFDGAASGLGGCPYASTDGERAPGNISTDLLVRTIEGEGFETGLDRAGASEAASLAAKVVADAGTAS